MDEKCAEQNKPVEEENEDQEQEQGVHPKLKRKLGKYSFTGWIGWMVD